MLFINVIMEADGKDRPPMLAPGNYVQWKYRIKRYIDTKPNHELIHYCLKHPPYKFKWAERIIPAVEGSLETTTEGYMENYKNVSEDIRNLLNVEAKVVHIILTRIDNCPNAMEMFYKMMNELVRNQCEVTNHQVNVQFLPQLQPEWQRNCQLSSTHYDQEPATVAKDDEMPKEKEIDKLMDLVSLSFNKIYKPTNNNLGTSSNTSRANQDNSLRINKCTGYDNQSVVNVTGAKETVSTQVVQQSEIQCYNCKEFGHVVRECQKPKRAKDEVYHKEKMLLCKKGEAGIQLSAEQVDWKDDTDDEPEDQKLEAHYLYMAKIHEVTLDAADNFVLIFNHKPLQKVQYDEDSYNVFANDRQHPEKPESVNDTYPDEQGDTNITTDSLDMSTNGEEADQDDDDDLARESDLLAYLIEKLKCEIDESKNHNKLLESSNKTLVDKLKNLKKFQAKLDRYHDVNYASKVEIECAKAKGELVSHKMSSEKSFNEYSRKINDLNQTISKMKKELIAHQESISIMSQEKQVQKKFYKTCEDRELEKVIALKNKIKVLDDIV
ncbi:integrase, catalytic region, zinc finger, CCHC-type containing protein [Tanacetum coccineum]